MGREQPDLEQPLLDGGEEEEAEVAKAAPKPPHVPSSFDLTDTAEEPQSQAETRSWGQWLRTSPFIPTACCIFLCFILKVVQQVCRHCTSCLLYWSLHSMRITSAPA